MNFSLRNLFPSINDNFLSDQPFLSLSFHPEKLLPASLLLPSVSVQRGFGCFCCFSFQGQYCLSGDSSFMTDLVLVDSWGLYVMCLSACQTPDPTHPVCVHGWWDWGRLTHGISALCFLGRKRNSRFLRFLFPQSQGIFFPASEFV